MKKREYIFIYWFIFLILLYSYYTKSVSRPIFVHLKGETKMKDTIKMIIDSVSGLKDVLLHIIGLGVLVQLVFVGGFLGIDIVGNLVGLVNSFGEAGFAGFISLIIILGLLNK